MHFIKITIVLTLIILVLSGIYEGRRDLKSTSKLRKSKLHKKSRRDDRPIVPELPDYYPSQSFSRNSDPKTFRVGANNEPILMDDDIKPKSFRSKGMKFRAGDDDTTKADDQSTKKPGETEATEKSEGATKKNQYIYVPVRAHWKIRTKQRLDRSTEKASAADAAAHGPEYMSEGREPHHAHKDCTQGNHYHHYLY